MFHLTQFILELRYFIPVVACYIILPYGSKNCTSVSGGKGALSFVLLFFNIINQRWKSSNSAEGCVYINFYFLWDSNIIFVTGGQVCLWLKEPCFSLISYAMLHRILWSCTEQVNCLHVSWGPFFIIFLLSPLFTQQQLLTDLSQNLTLVIFYPIFLITLFFTER